VIVEDVHDPHRLPIGEGPRRGVDLPGVVGTWPLESSPRRVGALARLRCHHPTTHQYPMNSGNRWSDLTAARKVVGNRLGIAVNGKFLAQPNDCALGLGRDPLRRRVWTPRPLHQPGGTFGFEPAPVLIQRDVRSPARGTTLLPSPALHWRTPPTALLPPTTPSAPCPTASSAN
jgi:hypothetical protein